jgi:hypothetical protein
LIRVVECGVEPKANGLPYWEQRCECLLRAAGKAFAARDFRGVNLNESHTDPIFKLDRVTIHDARYTMC